MDARDALLAENARLRGELAEAASAAERAGTLLVDAAAVLQGYVDAGDRAIAEIGELQQRVVGLELNLASLTARAEGYQRMKDALADVTEQLAAEKRKSTDYYTAVALDINQYEARLQTVAEIRVRLEAQLNAAWQALLEFVEWHGGAHEEGCPEDDTCACAGAPLNAKVNAVLWSRNDY